MGRFLLAAFLLAAGSANSSAQLWGWQVQPATDKLSGKQVMAARLNTANVKQESFKRTPVAQIVIHCDPRQPRVEIGFTGKVSSAATLSFGYRTDNSSAKIIRVSATSGRRGITLHNAVAKEFIQQLGSSTKLFVRTESRGVGRSEAEFNTSGAAAALNAALKDCSR